MSEEKLVLLSADGLFCVIALRWCPLKTLIVFAQSVYTLVYTKREKGGVLEKKKQLHFTVTA